jgi:hypothetical protein
MPLPKQKPTFWFCLLSLLVLADRVTGQGNELGKNIPSLQTARPEDTTREVTGEPSLSVNGESSQWTVMNSTSSSPLSETVSLLSRESQLKLTIGLDFLAVASTKRTFPRGLPLLVLPDSPFGADTNTFSAHGRQSFINATFSGPTIGDFQVGGNAFVFFQNDNLVLNQARA